MVGDVCWSDSDRHWQRSRYRRRGSQAVRERRLQVVVCDVDSAKAEATAKSINDESPNRSYCGRRRCDRCDIHQGPSQRRVRNLEEGKYITS